VNVTVNVRPIINCMRYNTVADCRVSCIVRWLTIAIPGRPCIYRLERVQNNFADVKHLRMHAHVVDE